MTRPDLASTPPDVPYGSDPARPKTWVWVLGVLYGLWFLFILAMAILQVSR